jgi:hypothetical protein
MPTVSTWSAEQLDMLRSQWGVVSVRLIAENTGHSKNSCLGKAHRMHLPTLPSPIRRHPEGHPATAKYTLSDRPRSKPMTKPKDLDEALEDAIKRLVPAAPEWPTFRGKRPEDREFYDAMRWAPGCPSRWPWKQANAGQ